MVLLFCWLAQELKWLTSCQLWLLLATHFQTVRTNFCRSWYGLEMTEVTLSAVLTHPKSLVKIWKSFSLIWQSDFNLSKCLLFDKVYFIWRNVWKQVFAIWRCIFDSVLIVLTRCLQANFRTWSFIYFYTYIYFIYFIYIFYIYTYIIIHIYLYIQILFSYFDKVPAGKLSHLKLRPQLKPPLGKIQIGKQQRVKFFLKKHLTSGEEV